MQAPINDDCETVARFVKRFNRNKRTWESSVKGGRHDPLVLSITSRNIDKTGALKPPKNVHTEKYIRPSDRWIAANPSSSIGRRAESRDYIRAEDLGAAFMNDPDSIVKHVVSRLDTSSNMYFLVHSPQDNLGLSLLPANMPQPSISQPNIPQPSIPQSNIFQSNISQPNIPQPSIPQSGVPQSSIPQPSIPQWNISQPNIPQLGIPQSSILQPSIPQPNIPQLSIPQSSIYQSSMPQWNMQPVVGSPLPSLATQTQPQSLQSCNIPNDDPSVSNTFPPTPFPTNNSSQLATTSELPSLENPANFYSSLQRRP
ncbi:hypothetical protein sscle_08g062860 [Sclerotinia sclerotiorum 1980 UF-70]|uniref:Uncharacterized protein n=1 Tax=Sclerotinia sclerotiorum (strain ATCC 18683 / 1980 / Ss-1) TaxID=665079 RepID=A0A1D9Q9D4_SCLS1|nr:hypothetical protein sscle_08g062860 [Sclerotinia sclerotiorum 1980 UF-70]